MELLLLGAARLGIDLTGRQQEQFQLYYQELVVWNGRMNLTAITDYNEVQTKHFLDSLSVVLAFSGHFGQAVSSVVDVGAGAGFPGVPLKIAFPDLHVVLLEATLKKVRFLDHLKEVLGLSGLDTISGRAEEIAHQEEYRERFSLAVSRGVARLPSLVEVTLPFCRVGGVMVVHKKGDITGEVESASRAIGLMGGRLRCVQKVDLEGLKDKRLLVVVDKVASTPADFPRRTGVPKKQPISN